MHAWRLHACVRVAIITCTCTCVMVHVLFSVCTHAHTDTTPNYYLQSEWLAVMEGDRNFQQRLEECFSTHQQLTRHLSQFTSSPQTSAATVVPQVVTSAPVLSLPQTQTAAVTVMPLATSSPVSLASALPTVVSLTSSALGNAVPSTLTSSVISTVASTGPSNVAPTIASGSSGEFLLIFASHSTPY